MTSSKEKKQTSRPGYEYLAAYMLGKVIQDLTVEFCNRWIEKRSRTHDQMVQAARSNPQNVAEGSTGESLKSYIKLAGVARGSNEELAKDFQDFLRQRNLPIWPKDHLKVAGFRKFRARWTPQSSLNSPNFPSQSLNTPNLPNDPTEAANLLLTLCNLEGFLLARLVESLKKKHEEQGGFTENLYRKRTEFRRRKSSGVWGIVLGISVIWGVWGCSSTHAGELANQFTVSFWVKPESSAVSRALFVKNNELRIVTNSSSQPLCQIYSGGAWQTAATSSSAIQVGSWSHVACSYDRSNLKIFVNGVQTGSQSLSLRLDDASTVFKTGEDDGGTYSDFQGTIDDVRVYNYARTPKQITEDMNAGHPVGGSPVGSPVAYYKMDEGYGTSSQDASQNNQDMTLVNTPAWTNSGKFGRALDFEKDSSEYGYAADSSGLSITSDLTVSAWIKPESVTGSTLFDIAGKWDYSGSAKESYLLAQYGTELRMYIDAAGNYKTTSGLGLAAGTWYHIAGVYNAAAQTVTLYVNAVNKSGSVTGTIPASIGDDTDRFHIGAEDSQGTAANFFDGLIDEVKVYNSALLPEQIAIDMNQGKVMQLGGQVSATGTTGQAAEYCVPGDSTSCAVPVGEWKFDEKTGGSVNDTSGNGNVGTWYGTGTHWNRGVFGSAGNFNGSSDYISIPNSDTFDLGSTFTVSLWVDWRSGAVPSTAARLITRKSNWNDANGWEITLESGYDTDLTVRGSSGNGYPPNGADDVVASWAAGGWHHIEVVYSGTSAYVYSDGVYRDTVTIASVQNNDNSILIGRYGASGSNYWNGKIDQVRIYGYARTAAQVAWDYNRGKPVGHWKMDEGEGDKAYDSSGNGNTGTLTTMDPPNDWVTGKFGNALDFDGSNDYVSTTASYINPQDFSVSAWFKTSSASGKKIVGFESNQTGTGSVSFDRHLYVDTSGYIRFGCYSAGARYITSSGTYNNNQWHLATATHSSSDNVAKLYVDGVYQGTFTYACQSYTGYWRVGSYELTNWDSGLDGYFQGQIDDVRVYNYALTAEQVRQVMNEGSVVRFGD